MLGTILSQIDGTFFIQTERFDKRTSKCHHLAEKKLKDEKIYLISCFIKTKVLPQDPGILVLEVNKLFNV